MDGQIIPTVVERDRLSESIRNSKPLQIGMRDNLYAFPGSIDDVRIYKRRLGDSEVSQLFEMGLLALSGVVTQRRSGELQALLSSEYRLLDERFGQLQSQAKTAEAELLEAEWQGVRRW